MTNVSRDLTRLLKQSLPVVVEPIFIDVLIYDSAMMQERSMKIPMYLPHELLAGLYEFDQSIFTQVLVGCSAEEVPDKCSHFWSRVKSAHWASSHPVFAEGREHLQAYTIPYRWHGDEVSYRTLEGGDPHGGVCSRCTFPTRMCCVAVPMFLFMGTPLHSREVHECLVAPVRLVASSLVLGPLAQV